MPPGIWSGNPVPAIAWHEAKFWGAGTPQCLRSDHEEIARGCLCAPASDGLSRRRETRTPARADYLAMLAEAV